MGDEDLPAPPRRRRSPLLMPDALKSRQPISPSSNENTLAPYPPPKISFKWSRLDLFLTARLLRFLAIFAFWVHDRWYKPYGNPPDHSFYIDSTISLNYPSKNAIKICVYLPPSSPSLSDTKDRGKRKAIINFHGGGFALGSATDDSRLCRMFTNHVKGGAVVFSVEYRLAPEYSWPTMVEDCAEAIIEICKRHEEYEFDLNNVHLSGCSAGGNGALTAWILLNSMEEYGYSLGKSPSNGEHLRYGDDDRSQRLYGKELPKIKGMIFLYPLMNYSIARKDKKLTIPNEFKRSDWKLNRFFLRLFDLSYIYPPLSFDQRKHPLISPSSMSDPLVEKLPPIHMVLCEYDMLRHEAMNFIHRMKTLGKEVTYQLIEGKGHGWDKPLPFKPANTVEGAYLDCVRKIDEWNTTELEDTDLEGSELEVNGAL